MNDQTRNIRAMYVEHIAWESSAIVGAEFDQWLAKVKADALREAAEALPRLEGTQITRQQAAAYWLRDEADRIESEIAHD